MPYRVVDEMGFVNEGGHLLLYFPCFNGILCYEVISRKNKGFETFNYGPINYTASGHAAGVVPSGSATDQYKFEWIDNRLTGKEKNNMFYFEESDKLIHLFMTIKPELIMNYIYYPENVMSITYADKVTTRPDQGDRFGYFSGTFEIVNIPYVEWSLVSYNPTNMDLNTFTRFLYADYEVEFIDDVDTMKKMWLEEIPVKKVTMPAFTSFRHEGFSKAYDIDQPYKLSELGL